MKNRKQIYIVIAVSVLVLVVIYWITDFKALKKNKVQIKNYVNWKESYAPEGKSPYDTYIFYELLKHYTKTKNNKFKEISKKHERPVNKGNTPALYVTVGKNIYLDHSNCINLLQFVEAGNYAFIAAETLPLGINEVFTYARIEVKNKWGLKTELTFTDTNFTEIKNYTFPFYNQHGIILHNWSYFDKTETNQEDTNLLYLSDTIEMITDSLSNSVSDEKFKVLEIQENNQAVFVKIEYGKGVFYFHSVPLCFTNISLLKERNIQHAEKVLSYLPDGDIIWDKYAPLEIKHDYNQTVELKKQSPLQFILRNPPLRWAFYIMLAAVFIYVVFRIKRKQRIIPPLEDKENTSVEFAETLSGIYLQQQKHKSIAMQMRKIWLHYIREKYHINISQNDRLFIILTAKKSGITENKVQTLYNIFEKTQKSNSLTVQELITLHEQLEYFYKNCN